MPNTRKLVLVAVRVVLGMVLAGTLVVQLVMVPLLWSDLGDLDPAHDHLRLPLIAITVLGLVAVQVVVVCVGRLVTMVARGTVFSDAAFREVDVVIGALAAAAALMFGYAVALAPGEAVAPGVVALICGASLMIGGGALIVLVMRMLLRQAIARDAEATDLQAELAAVI